MSFDSSSPDEPTDSDPSQASTTAGLRIALAHPKLRAWLIAGSIEWGAITFLAVALGYVVHEVTDSAIWLGVQVAALTAPYTLLSLHIGEALDRFERRKLLLVGYVSELILAAVLGLLYGVGLLNLPVILIASLLFGILLTFEVPANWLVIQSYTPAEHLTSVFAVSITMSNIAIAVSMIIGGLTLATLGFGYVTVLYILAATPVVFVILHQRKSPPVRPIKETTSPDPATGLRETMRLARRNKTLHTALILIPLVGALILPLLWQLPAMADWAGGEVLLTAGLAAAAYAGAALVGPLMVWLGHRGVSMARRVAVSFMVAAITMAVAGLLGEGAQSPGRIVLLMTALLIIGASLTVLTVNLTSAVQSNSPEEMRGRFLGLSGLFLDGLLPIAAVVWGITIHFVDFGYALGIAATILLLAIIWRSRRPGFDALSGRKAPQ